MPGQLETTLARLRENLVRLRESFDRAVAAPVAEQTSGHKKYIAFSLGPEFFAWPAACLREILLDHKIAPIPANFPMLHGVINYKNRVLPVIDLHRRLAIESGDFYLEKALLIARGPENDCAFLADKLAGILSLGQEEIRPKPVSLAPDIASCVDGEVYRGKQMFTILNPASLLNMGAKAQKGEK
jgi:chemotaxis signal transduction protein